MFVCLRTGREDRMLQFNRSARLKVIFLILRTSWAHVEYWTVKSEAKGGLDLKKKKNRDKWTWQLKTKQAGGEKSLREDAEMKEKSSAKL